MKTFELPIDVNKLGSDPLVHLYNALNSTYPADGLTSANSRILKIQPAATASNPNLTYLRIQKGENEGDIYEYFYNRYNINDYLKNPIFTSSEAVRASKLPDSVKLVGMISTKVKLNFLGSDFWTSINSLDFSGGTVTPNWLMQSTYNSIYWCGSMYVWLHT